MGWVGDISGKLPPPPSTGHSANPTALGKDTYSLVYGGRGGGGGVGSHKFPQPIPFWAWLCATSDPATKSDTHYGHLTRYRCLSWKYGPTPVILLPYAISYCVPPVSHVLQTNPNILLVLVRMPTLSKTPVLMSSAA